jgi:mRNA interferase RelE/StbE
VYKIDLPKRVIKQLDKVPNRDYPSISKAIQNLTEIPRPTGCKKLLESFYRMRIGDFRIIYWVDDKNKSIVITKVERRKERTYKHL